MTTPHTTEGTWAASTKLAAFRQRVLAWTAEEINTGWEDVIVPQGAAEVGILMGDSALRQWAANWLDWHLEGGIREDSRLVHRKGDGEIVRGVCLNDYCGNWGFAFAAGAIFPVKDEARYREAIVQIADFIVEGSLRAPDGCVAHGGFSQTIWVDTLYYCAPPLAQAYAVTGDTQYAEAALTQCRLHAKYLRNENTGLWHHDADPKTGARTINLWSRGLGWILCALADTLTLVPVGTPGYAEVLGHYRSLAEASVRLQHESGLWRVMPENPLAHLETSGTAMILTGLLRGLNAGWLQPYILPMVDRGLRELETWIHDDGRLLGSQFPSGRGGWDHLKLTPFGENTYTTGFLMRALAAREQFRQRS